MTHDYYKILGVSPDADLAAIRSAYMLKARTCHPDHGGSHAEMVLVNEAWEVLSNPESRRSYDAYRKDRKNSTAAEEFANAERRARHEAQSYPQKWTDFESWLKGLAADYGRARYGEYEWLGSSWPTAGRSISGWIFIVAGALIGFVMSFTLLALMMNLQKLGAFTVYIGLFSALCGAWAGRYMHYEIGPMIKVRKALALLNNEANPQRLNSVDWQEISKHLNKYCEFVFTILAGLIFVGVISVPLLWYFEQSFWTWQRFFLFLMTGIAIMLFGAFLNEKLTAVRKLMSSANDNRSR